MANDNEISTPVAFINGKVEVNGIPPVSQDRVLVYANSPTGTAQANLPATACAPEAGQRYSMTVKPGDWTVYAVLGPVQSAQKVVTVKSGQSVEVDFSFGVDKD